MPYSASQLTTFYTNANMGITPSAAESLLIQAYAQQNANGAITDAVTLNDVLALSRDKTDVAVATYEFFTGATPTLAGLSYLVHGGGNANDLSSAYYANFNTENRYYNFAINLAFGGPNASGFATTYGAMTFTQAVSAAYELIIGSANATAAGIDPVKAQASIASSLSFFQALAAQRAPSANQDLATKAIMIGYILEEAIKADVGTYAKGVDGFMNALATTGTAVTGDLLANYPATAAGVTFALTTGIDSFSGGNGNDTVTSTGDNGGASATLTALDSVNGGGGNNVFSLTDSAGAGIIAAPASASITNFQTVNLTSTAGVTFDTTKITGDTQLNVTAAAAANLTAATTTNVTASAVGGAGGNTVTGGLNVSLTDAGGADTLSGAAGTVTLTDAAQAAFNVTVNGGTNDVVSVAGSTGGTVTVGNTTAPTGTVTVNETVSTAAATGAAIAVTGGTSVTVNETAGNAVNTTVTFGGVTVTGASTTTAVTVNETAAATAAAKVAGVVDSAVTINDVNAGAAKVGTIATISLANVASATISDNALATLNVSGVNGAIGITENAAAGDNVPTLALNLNAATTGVITDVTGVISTVNVTTSGASASTVAGITDAALKTLNVSGSTGGLALTAVNAGISTLTVSGGASFSGDISGTAVKSFAPTSTGKITATISGATQSFTGGAGVDVITTATDAVKTITGGSSGANEIILNNTAATFATPANITNFQILGTQAATSGAFDVSKFAGVTALDMQASGGAVTFNKVTAGTSLSLDGGGLGGNVIYSTADTNGASDQVAVTLGTAAGGSNAFGVQLTVEDSVLNGIGTVVINSLSKAPTPPAANFVNTLGTLNDTGMTALTFAGNADTTITTLVDNGNTVTIANAGTATNTETISGWTDNNLKSLTLSGNVALTLTDGLTSGVTVAGATDNAAVSLTLTGAGAAKADSISLGNGNNTVTDHGTGTIGITLGNGTNSVTADGAGTVTIATGTGANTITANGAGVDTVTVGASGTKAESVTFGLGTNTATFGAHTGVDNVTVAAHNLVNPGAAGVFLSAVVTGLNSSATGADTITFGTDAGATGAVTVVSTATINAYAAATGSDATQLATALNAVLDAANGGAGLAQHHVAEFSFQGNTYIVEQADLTGHTLANEAVNSLTVVELVGVVPVTGASAAAAGVLALHG